MAQALKKRFIKYMTEHYSRMSSKEIDNLLSTSMERVIKHTDFSEKVLSEVVDEMLEEGYKKAEILAHVNMIDLEHRT